MSSSHSVTRETCRVCGGTDLRTFLDLGELPLPDAFVTPEMAAAGPCERFPLVVAFCGECTTVQITEDVSAEKMFVENYLYFSSFSDHLLRHSRDHALDLIERRSLTTDSLVVEVASNDGYLLKNFVEQSVPVLGIDPAPTQAARANEIGVPTLAEFFGAALAKELVGQGRRADVIIAKNVMAHVPDLNDFTAGLATLVADDGVIEVENPYVRDLIDHCEYDTIYHEHVTYWSCTAISNLVRRHGLFLNDVTYFPDLHGGTLRWQFAKTDNPSPAVQQYLADEAATGIDTFDYYAGFADRVNGLRAELLRILEEVRAQGARVVGYGAAAKGTIMLNAVGISTDLVETVVDRNPHKQGLRMPGTRQLIADPALLLDEQPEYVLILAWNFAEEIMNQQAEYAGRGGRFIVPVPEPRIVRGASS